MLYKTATQIKTLMSVLIYFTIMFKLFEENDPKVHLLLSISPLYLFQRISKLLSEE